jgi:hypothetical protein
MISRATEGLDGVFFGTTRDCVDRIGCETRDFETRGTTLDVAGVWGGCMEAAQVVARCASLSAAAVVLVAGVLVRGVFSAEVCTSGGSEDGGSSPMLGFNGVRNGDLNGFWSVFVASFSRRRFACGVGIFAAVWAFGIDEQFLRWWG